MTHAGYGGIPYPGFDWRMNQHMGVASGKAVYQLLLIANEARSTPDPATPINEYLGQNKLFTKNIRKDTRQSETWRDYQQILADLGLMVSTRRRREIDPTPLGLAFIDKTLSYHELVTLQALRFQYPNGQKTAVSSSVRRSLHGTKYANANNLAEIEEAEGVLIRPGVLVWRVLRELRKRRERQDLSLREISAFLVPCYRHEYTMDAVEAICAYRREPKPRKLKAASRKVQEWRQLLRLTPLFSSPSADSIRISPFGNAIGSEVDEICDVLEKPESFWRPTGSSEDYKVDWFAEYGSLDVSIDLIPRKNADGVVPANDISDELVANRNLPRRINLRPFDPGDLENTPRQHREDQMIRSAYQSSKSRDQIILHNQMVKLIAQTCSGNGGTVFHDPQSVDLLIEYKKHEFLVEVKSVTPNNFVTRLRLALGQLLHYDFLRATDNNAPRRKVVAVAARVPKTSWSVPFVSGFLDWDLLSLGTKGLDLQTSFQLSTELFAEPKEQNLFDFM